MLEKTILLSLFVGKVSSPWPGKAKTGMIKLPTEDSTFLSLTGLQSDEQADLRVHGGIEKALHHYPADHYPIWSEELGPNDMFRPGGFGENVSTIGWTEKNVCIGDVVKIGKATVQISQGRQPCWKLNTHTGNPRMALYFQTTARTGWYYRVIETGKITKGDHLTLIERPNPDWTVERVTLSRLNRTLAPELAEQISTLVGLAPRWREAFEKKSKNDLNEDVSKRLRG